MNMKSLQYDKQYVKVEASVTHVDVNFDSLRHHWQANHFKAFKVSKIEKGLSFKGKPPTVEKKMPKN